MKLIILVVLWMLVTATCKAQVVLGLKSPNTLTIGDFTSDDLTSKDIFGFERYGIGHGQMEVSDRLAITADNRSGLFLGSGDGLKLGIEPAGGEVAYKDRPLYQWEPGVSAGIRETVGKLGVYVAPRAGMAYSNHVNDCFTGAVIELQVFGLRVTYWENDYKFMNTLRVYNLDMFNKINVETRQENGDTTTTLGVRFEI